MAKNGFNCSECTWPGDFNEFNSKKETQVLGLIWNKKNRQKIIMK